jgi:D-arabinose 5-phosphate isomerase GutQ
MADLTKALAAATSALNTEIAALTNFAQSLEANLKPALEIIIESKGHVVVTGLGKSVILLAQRRCTSR